MKLPAVLFALSVAANAALLTAFALRPALAPPAFRHFFNRTPTAAEAAAEGRAATVRAEIAAAQNAAQATAMRAKLWSVLHSDDLTTLVARLRAAGFSPSVVRAIVTAEVDQRFRPRIKQLVAPVTDAPFWKADQLNSYNNPKFFEEYNQLSRERTKLVREALGDDLLGNSLDTAAIEKRRQFGNLPQAKIDVVQRISDDYTEMISQVRAATQGIILPEDREKLALLEQEKRTDLAAILTPQELVEYEMRTSNLTMRLRSALTLMNASEEEFRTIYQVQQPFADTLYPSVGVSDWSKRNDVLKEAADQLKVALGDQRYREYARASNYEFQQLSGLAQREGIPNETAVRAFDLRDKTAAESTRIYDDKTLSADQKRAALQALAQNTTAQIVSTLGVTAGTTYAQTARWLSAVERGGAVSFGPDGNSTNTRMLAAPRR